MSDLKTTLTVVDDAASLADAASVLESASVVGLDCEWRPYRGPVPTPVSLLQVATHDQAFLFDLLTLEAPLQPAPPVPKQPFDGGLEMHEGDGVWRARYFYLSAPLEGARWLHLYSSEAEWRRQSTVRGTV